MNTYDPRSGVEYRAPVAGYYQIAAKVVRLEATGRTVFRVNPRYRWWKPWEEIVEEIPEYREVQTMDGSEIKFLAEGEVVIGPAMRL